MHDLISRQALYEKTAEWEAQALHMVEKTMNDEDLTEWRKWSIILKERSAFKFDVADAPSAERKGKWISGKDVPNRNPYEHLADAMYCSECLEEAYWDADYGQQMFDYCPNCGARMERIEE